MEELHHILSCFISEKENDDNHGNILNGHIIEIPKPIDPRRNCEEAQKEK